MSAIPRTTAQIEASRRNGTRSRGPKTAAGKARSAGNASRHGLTSRTIVLVHEEDRAAYAALRADIMARHRPQGALESHWAKCLLDALWRQSRLDLLESRVLEGLIAGEEGGGLPSLATLARYRARIARDIREAEARLGELREARIDDAVRSTARDPARLRQLAALLEAREATTHAEATERTNEPEHAAPSPAGEDESDRSEPGACLASVLEQAACAAAGRPGEPPRDEAVSG